MTSLRPPFFVLGSGRSGTSLLTRMLDAHSAIAVPYESHLYNRIYPLLPRDIDLGAEATRRRLVREILRSGPLQHWSPRPSLDATLAAIRRLGFHGIVEGLFAGWAAGRGKSRWGQKTPQHTLCWRTILDGFPDLRVLHLVRDGRDVALSFRDAPFGPKHAYQAALHWMKYLSATEEAREVLGERGFLAVRYEDLLESPEGELRRICTGNLAQLRRPVRGENREKWRTRLSPRDQRIFEAVAGDWLGRFGYPRVVPDARISRWEALACRSLDHPPRRLRSRLRNRAGYGYALETLRLRLTLPRLA